MREAKRILAKQPHWIIEEIQKENSLERLEQKTISWKVDHEKNTFISCQISYFM